MPLWLPLFYLWQTSHRTTPRFIADTPWHAHHPVNRGANPGYCSFQPRVSQARQSMLLYGCLIDCSLTPPKFPIMSTAQEWVLSPEAQSVEFLAVSSSMLLSGLFRFCEMRVFSGSITFSVSFNKWFWFFLCLNSELLMTTTPSSLGACRVCKEGIWFSWSTSYSLC